MKTITVILGERDYEIHPLVIRATREWQAKARKPLDTLLYTISNIGSVNLTKAIIDPETGQTKEAFDLTAVMEVGQVLLDTIMGSTDLIQELLFSYAPGLIDDLEYIENNAYNEQIFEAFLKVLGLVYPLGTLTQLLGRAKL
jgi:hypothetical protein